MKWLKSLLTVLERFRAHVNQRVMMKRKSKMNEIKYFIAIEPNHKIELEERKRTFEFVKKTFEFKNYIGRDAKQVHDSLKAENWKLLESNSTLTLGALLSAYLTSSTWIRMYAIERARYREYCEERTCEDLKRASKFLVEYMLLKIHQYQLKLSYEMPDVDVDKFSRMQIISEKLWGDCQLSNQTHLLFPETSVVSLNNNEWLYMEATIPKEDQQLFSQHDQHRDRSVNQDCPRFSVLNHMKLEQMVHEGTTFVMKFNEIFHNLFSYEEINSVIQFVMIVSGHNLSIVEVDHMIELVAENTKVPIDRVRNIIEIFTFDTELLCSVPEIRGDEGAHFSELYHLLNENKIPRITYNPIMKLNIDDVQKYVFTGTGFNEALIIFYKNIIFTEINQDFSKIRFHKELGELKNWCTEDWFENAIAEELREKIGDKFTVHKSTEFFGVNTKHSGNYDLIVFSNDGESVFVIDCKLVKMRLMPKDFKNDLDTFGASSRYVKKLTDKIENFEKNIDQIKSGVLKKYKINISDSVEITGAFVTAYPSFADLKEPTYRIIGAKEISSFILSFNKKDV